MRMSIELSPLQRLDEFPITRTRIFLAHAAISPFSRRVCQAIQDYCHNNTVYGQWEYLYGDMENEARRYAAALLDGQEDEIAFVPSTSVGLNIVAGGLNWKPGDNVVVADGDFPANVYPWLALRYYGVETRFIPRRYNGAVYLEDIQKIIDQNTRLISLSSVNFVTGFRPDIKAIGSFLKAKAILFCIDAIQSLGALPLDSNDFDFATASAHKWLMGPMGIGVLYVKRVVFDLLHPPLPGWKSVRDNKKYLNYNLDFPDSAKRYESGSPNGLGLVGLHATLEMLTDVGIDNIAIRLSGFRRALASSLAEMGYEVISPIGTEGSGIVSFTDDKVDIRALRNQLDAEGFVVSLRETLDNRKCIRVSPHFYNTYDEISAFLDRVRCYREKALCLVG